MSVTRNEDAKSQEDWEEGSSVSTLLVKKEVAKLNDEKMLFIQRKRKQPPLPLMKVEEMTAVIFLHQNTIKFNPHHTIDLLLSYSCLTF